MHRPSLAVFAVAIGAWIATSTPADELRSLGVVEDFAAPEIGPFQKGHVDHWRWNDEQRSLAKRNSLIEIVAGDVAGSKRLHVRIDGELPGAPRSVPILRLSPHFPPESDLLRLRMCIVSGTARLYVGGPTAYYGDSDVFSVGRDVRAAAKPHDEMVDFSLNHPLCRNFRRSGFSTDARRIYYTRWAQEPTGIYLSTESPCEFYLDAVELLATGEGRPFAEFAAADVEPITTLADFEDGRLDRAFNLYMAAAETEWFEDSWRRDRPLRFAPAKLAIVADDKRGTKALETVGRYAEEVYCSGVRTDGGDPRANAVQITLTHDAPAHRNTVVGLGRAEPIDLFVFVAPAGQTFPWDEFGPSAELRRGPGPGFDYQFTYREIVKRQDVDFAIYQTRRYVRPNERTTLVLPIADFTCVYGSGKLRDRFIADAAPTCDNVIAVAWLTPWCRVGGRNADVTTRVDDVSLVRVPGDAAAHRSFRQIEDWTGANWGDEGSGAGRILYLYQQSDGGPKLLPGR